MLKFARAIGCFVASLSLVLTLGLSGCFTRVERTDSMQETPSSESQRDAASHDEDGVIALINSTAALFSNPTQANLAQIGISTGDGSESGYGSYDDQLAYYHNLSIEASSIEISGDTATVELSITNADFEKASDLAQQDFSAWKAGHGNNDSSFLDFYNERLLSGDIETKTVYCTLSCAKQDDGTWAWTELPGNNQQFMAALSGVEAPRN